MPTIDQLAPATAASDTDELMASQSGTARKVTRAQLVSGLQPQLALASGTLLGRASSGTGAAEQIAVGANLILNSGTLAAAAAPFTIANLPARVVPSATDLVPIGHSGINTAVPYAQFVAGISAIPAINASAMTVTPTGATAAQKLADFAAGAFMRTGGTLSGAVTLAADPVSNLQAATKQYVDTQFSNSLPRNGGTLTGGLTLQANPVTQLQAATKQYVDTQVATAVPLAGGIMSGPLTVPALLASGTAVVGGTLSSGPISVAQTASATSTLAAQVGLQRAGSGPSDAPVMASTVTVAHPGAGGSIYANGAFATTVNDAINSTGTLIDGPSTAVHAISSTLVVNAIAGSSVSASGPQHVAVYGSAVKNLPAGGYPAGRSGPQVCGLWLPVSDATNQPSNVGNGLLGAQIGLAANNLDPANSRIGSQITLNDAVPVVSGGLPTESCSAVRVSTSADSYFKWHIASAGNYSIAVLDTRAANGASSKVTTTLAAASATIAVDPVVPFSSAGALGAPVSATNTAAVQVGSGTYTLIGVSVDGGGKTSGKLTFASPVSVADGTAGNVVTGASRAIWLGSGQKLAFDTAGSATLFYDPNLQSLRTTAPLQVGGTLAVTGTLNAGAVSLSGPVSVGSTLACTGTISAATFVSTTDVHAGGNLAAAGTVIATGAAQLGPTTVTGSLSTTGNVQSSGTVSAAGFAATGTLSIAGSAGVSGALNVKGGLTASGGLVMLPTYTVATLPPAAAGALAYATNGRKPGEAAGAGSGVLVWGTAAKQWLSAMNGAAVQA